MSKAQLKAVTPSHPKLPFAAGLVLIVAATLAAYIPAMRATYVWDDDVYVTRNPLLVASDGLFRIWFSMDSPSQYFPMVYTSFRLEYKLWGLNPAGYHITNVTLHVINAILLWLLLRYMSIRGAWVIAAIFALHPVQVESVAWITERKNILMAFFYFLSFLAWLRFVSLSEKSERAWPLYLLSLVLCRASLLSKTTACTMPVALILSLWLKRIPLTWKRWLQIAAYVMLGLAMGMLTVWWELYHLRAMELQLGMNAIDRILLASRAIWFYLAKLVWPVNLTFSYPKWQISSSEPLQYLWPLACVAVGFCLWFWRKQLGKGCIATVVFFVATLFPMLGFFKLYTFRYSYVADHYQYVASIGPIAIVVAAGCSLINHRGWWLRTLAIIVTASVLVSLAVLTWRQCHAYKDFQSLYEDTLRKNPQSFMSCGNLGVIYMRRGAYQEAIQIFKRAESIKTGAGAYNLACVYALMGDKAECQKWLKFCEQAGVLPSRKVAISDPDLRSVRNEEWFKQIRWPQDPE